MNRKLWTVATFIILLTSACGFGETPTPDQSSIVLTQQAIINWAVSGTATSIAAQNQISALETENAILKTLSAQPGPAGGVTVMVVTATPEPATATPTATLATATSTNTPTAQLPTSTNTPAAIPTSTSTPTVAVPCNKASFVADVTVPDGTVFLPSTSFVKTWRLKNTGACAWTTAYDMVFVSGSQMSAPTVVDLPGNVSPGQTIDLSVSMIAPNDPGSYQSNWKLRDPSGNLFGVGASSTAFYVAIKVASPTASLPLDMAAMFCSAEWTSGGNRLPCPGTVNDSRGYVVRIDKPTLESGYVDDEPALLTQPQMVTDSYIRGRYPTVRVESGYHFVSTIGCAYQSSGCNVKFQLDYQIGNGAITTLAAWNEAYEGQFRLVDVDVSGLAGKDVNFILTVLSNGDPANDRAQWLLPRITK